MKFNAFALSDYSKKNDNIIFTYDGGKINKDSSWFIINKYENNKNLITKEIKMNQIMILLIYLILM